MTKNRKRIVIIYFEDKNENKKFNSLLKRKKSIYKVKVCLS